MQAVVPSVGAAGRSLLLSMRAVVPSVEAAGRSLLLLLPPQPVDTSLTATYE